MLAFLQQDLIPQIPLSDWTSRFVDYIKGIEVIDEGFDLITDGISAVVAGFEAVLNAPPEMWMVAIFAVIAFFLTNSRVTAASIAGLVLGSVLLVSFPLWGDVIPALAQTLNVPGWLVSVPVFAVIAALFFGSGIAVFAVLGFVLLISFGLWEQTMLSLALVLASTIVALFIGVPIGVLAAKSRAIEAAARPTLDIMQTMPAFVYLVPMVVFLGLGAAPGLVATVIFAAPPAVRLTLLGIQQVPQNTVEAAHAFGATPWQTLRKVELPQALPTILSMVVIAALVGAGGLGEIVLRGLSRLDVGSAFTGGVGIVIIAIYLDRVTRSLGRATQRKSGKGNVLSKVLPRRKKADVDPDTAGATGAGAEDTVGAGGSR
jgi:glycine betaine/proline transport system permease protein